MRVRAHWRRSLLFLLFAGLTLRWFWLIQQSDTGWAPHRETWVISAAGLLERDYLRLRDADPAVQAEFWLQEIDRIPETQTDPELALGAAWMLDGPEYGFLRRYYRRRADFSPYFPTTDLLPVTARMELDDAAVERALDEFESRCRERCLEQIETATRLDQDNPEVWRAQALLLFEEKAFSSAEGPRREDWLLVLDICRDHDPENALYDYLAARQLGLESAEYLIEQDILQVNDPIGFRQSNEFMAAGLKKPRLQFGTAHEPATLALLRRTSLPTERYPEVAAGRLTDHRASTLKLRGLLIWQAQRAMTSLHEGDVHAAVERRRELARIEEQLVPEGNTVNRADVVPLRPLRLAGLLKVEKEHPGTLSAAEVQELEAELQEARIEEKIRVELIKRVEAQRSPPRTLADLLQCVLTWVASQVVLLCLPSALLFGLVAWLGRRGNSATELPVRLRWWRHLLSWVAGLALSFLFLGLFPAGMVSPAVQTWVLRGLIAAGCSLPLWWLLWLLRREFGVPVGPFVALTILAALAGVLLLERELVAEGVMLAFSRLSLPLLLAVLAGFGLLAGFLADSLRRFLRMDALSRRRKLLLSAVLLGLGLLVVPSGRLLVTRYLGSLRDGLRVPPSGDWSGLPLTPEELQAATKLEDSWGWVLLQWDAWRGLLAAGAGAVIILMVWSLIRCARSRPGGWRELFRDHKRHALSQIAGEVARSTGTLGVVALLVYLAVAPAVSEYLDTKYRTDLQFFDDAAMWELVENTQTEIRADEALMNQFRDEVAEEERERREREP